MSLRSPFTTQIERGGYSEIIYIDGDLIVAEDWTGTAIKENTDAATVIEAAIDELPSSGGKIKIAKGTYDIATQIDNFKSNVYIEGCGISTILNNTTTSWNAIFKILGTLGSEKKNISISDLQLIGDKTKDQGHHIDMEYCHYCEITKCWLDEGKLDGLTAVNSDYCKIESNVFEDTEDGIDIDDCDNNVISDNLMFVRSNAIYLDTCDGSRVSNNRVYNQAWHGVYLIGVSSKNVIADNICHGSTSGIGIYLDYVSGEGSPCGNSITGNSCCGNCEGVTFDHDCCQNTIVGNVCNANTSDTGIEINGGSKRNIISGNECCDNSNEGLHIGTDSDNNIMTGNICYGNLYGILIAGATADKNLIDACILLNNTTANLSDLGTGTVLGTNITS